eukprot:208291-Hanusia_phi.AAC.3
MQVVEFEEAEREEKEGERRRRRKGGGRGWRRRKGGGRGWRRRLEGGSVDTDQRQDLGGEERRQEDELALDSTLTCSSGLQKSARSRVA